MRRLAILILPLVLAACTDEDGAQRALKGQGFHDIKMTGFRPFMCDGKQDFFSTGFSAIGPTGIAVTGAVCSGVLKGHTIRSD